MAVYRVRWICPATRKPRFRDFHTKREAAQFKALPREVPAELERLS